jgi:hypothetical protein
MDWYDWTGNKPCDIYAAPFLGKKNKSIPKGLNKNGPYNSFLPWTLSFLCNTYLYLEKRK